MADRYWISGAGGTGNWNDTARWSASSGGPTGASVPTTADNVFFDNASHTSTFTVTITAGSACANFNASGITDAAKKMTISGSGSLNVAGGWVNPSTTFYLASFSSAITFSSTTTGNIINTNGVSFTTNANATITFDGVGGGWTLASAFTFNGTNNTITLTNGALDLGGFTLTTAYFVSNNSNIRSIAFGSTGSIIVGSSGASIIWNCNTLTNFSYTGTSSVIANSLSSGISTVGHGATAGGSASTAINVTVTGSLGTVNVSTSHLINILCSSYTGALNMRANIYGNLTLIPGMTLVADAATTNFVGSGTQNITTAGLTFDRFVAFAGTGTYVLVDNFNAGSTRSITLTSGTLNINNNTVTAASFASSNSNVRSIAFGTGNITLIGSGTIWTTATSTNFTRTGTPTVNISNNSATATTVSTGTLSEAQALDFNYTTGTYALTDTSAVYRNLNFTGFAGTVPNSVRTIYGNLILVSGPTYTAGTNATTFAATSGTQSVTTNSRTLDFPVTQNNPGATLSLQDNFTLGSTRAYTLTAGTFNVNGKTASVGTFASTGAATRAITFGTSGNITVVSSGAAAWNASGSGLTTTGTTSTISMTSASAKTFVGGGFNYAATLNQGGAGTLTISGSNTLQGISNTYGATGATTITFTAGTTQTVSAFTASGASGNLLTLNSSSAGARFNLSDPSGSVNVSFCSIKDSNATGGARWNSYLSNGNINAGNNLGWDFSQRGGLSPVPGLSGANGLSLGVGLVGNL